MALLDEQYYNSHIKRSLSGAYRPHGDPSKADAVIATGFGYRVHNGRALPSLATNQIAAAVHAFEHLPKILTHDLAVAYRRLFPHDPQNLIVLNHYPEHLTNSRMASEFHMYLEALKLHKPLLIGHQHHLPWIDYLCGQIAVHTIVPEGLQFAFDPVSAQPWTRDKEAWQAEIRSRLDAGHAEAYYPETLRLHH
jgi:hypothetical protein